MTNFVYWSKRSNKIRSTKSKITQMRKREENFLILILQTQTFPSTLTWMIYFWSVSIRSAASWIVVMLCAFSSSTPTPNSSSSFITISTCDINDQKFVRRCRWGGMDDETLYFSLSYWYHLWVCVLVHNNTDRVSLFQIILHSTTTKKAKRYIECAQVGF